MKKFLTCVFLLAISVIAFAQTAPGAVPPTTMNEIWHVLSIISGYNVLMSALQGLFSKAAAPNKTALVAGVKTVAAAVAQAAATSAAAQVSQVAAPTLTAAQTAAAATLSLVKVLSANPDVPPTPSILPAAK